MDTGFISTGRGMLSQEDYEALAVTGSAERNLATGQLFDPDAYALAQTWSEWTSGELIRATPFPYLLEQQYLDECSRHAIDAFLGWPFFGVHDSTRARHLLLNIVRDTRDMERPSRNVYENMPLEIVRAFIRAVHARTNPLVVNSELRHFRTENSMLRESYLFVRNHTLSASMAIGDGKTPRQQLESIFRSRRTIIWSRQHYVAVRRVEEFPASSPPCYAWLDSLERGIILLSALGLARRLCERLLSSYGIYALCLIDTATPASATTVDATATAIEEVVRKCSATSPRRRGGATTDADAPEIVETLTLDFWRTYTESVVGGSTASSEQEAFRACANALDALMATINRDRANVFYHREQADALSIDSTRIIAIIRSVLYDESVDIEDAPLHVFLHADIALNLDNDRVVLKSTLDALFSQLTHDTPRDELRRRMYTSLAIAYLRQSVPPDRSPLATDVIPALRGRTPSLDSLSSNMGFTQFIAFSTLLSPYGLGDTLHASVDLLDFVVELLADRAPNIAIAIASYERHTDMARQFLLHLDSKPAGTRLVAWRGFLGDDGDDAMSLATWELSVRGEKRPLVEFYVGMFYVALLLDHYDRSVRLDPRAVTPLRQFNDARVRAVDNSQQTARSRAISQLLDALRRKFSLVPRPISPQSESDDDIAEGYYESASTNDDDSIGDDLGSSQMDIRVPLRANAQRTDLFRRTDVEPSKVDRHVHLDQLLFSTVTIGWEFTRMAYAYVDASPLDKIVTNKPPPELQDCLDNFITFYTHVPFERLDIEESSRVNEVALGVKLLAQSLLNKTFDSTWAEIQ